uniref:CD99 antigen-like protein 2 n=1 Tax=Cairina moschata TaxID=8855 RepID=A0A8C3GEB8_CAIMO
MLTGHQSPPRAPFPASLCFLGAPTDTRTDRHRHQHSWHPASLTSLTPIKPHAVFRFHYICCFLGYFLPSPPREGSCQTPSCRRRFPFSSDQLLLLFLKLFQMMTWLASWTEATALTRRKVSTGLRVGLHPQPEAQGPRLSHGASQMRSAPSAVVGKGSRDPPMDLKGSGGSAMPPTPRGSNTVETGTIAGIASALAMALVGAVSSYISYQQKKFCFSIQRKQPLGGEGLNAEYVKGENMEAVVSEEPQVKYSVLETQSAEPPKQDSAKI